MLPGAKIPLPVVINVKPSLYPSILSLGIEIALFVSIYMKDGSIKMYFLCFYLVRVLDKVKVIFC
jgi:hypothetical protein